VKKNQETWILKERIIVIDKRYGCFPQWQRAVRAA
jgi:hypothetical protein